MNIHQSATAGQQLYQQATAAAAIGAWECNLVNEALFWTYGVYDLFGLPRGSTIQRSSTLDLYEETSRCELQRLRSSAIRTGTGFSLDCRIRTASNERRWMRLVVGVDSRQGRPNRIFGSKQDVTAEKGLWNGLAALARNEPVSEPSVRRGFDDRIRQILLDPGLRNETLALVIFDIDDFRGTAEAFGKAAADALLRCFEERMARLFPDALANGRVGEDEFALLLRMTGDQRRLAASLESARRLLCRPVPYGQMVVDFTASIGAAAIDTGRHRDHFAVFAEAEAALQVATLAGGNCLRFFDRPLAAPPAMPRLQSS